VDNALEVVRELSGAFEPVAFSVDEGGLLHLLADEPGGGRALWVVDPSTGVREVRAALAPPFDQATAPPLLLHRRGVVLQAPLGLLCLGPDGAVRWARRVSLGSGAVATADDQLLAADGSELVTFDSQGQRTVLHRFDGESLVGPPLLDRSGEITVATSSKVLRLRPKR
jgi:hypothetical protein